MNKPLSLNSDDQLTDTEKSEAENKQANENRAQVLEELLEDHEAQEGEKD